MDDSPDPTSPPRFHRSDPDDTEFPRTRNGSVLHEDWDDIDEAASAICFPGPRLIRRGFVNAGLLEPETTVIFVNVGGGAHNEQGNSNVHLQPDSFFQGGDVIRTDETVIEGGDMPFLYQSARFGNCCYQFDSLIPGDYTVDLHFAEIINTNGPKGMRVFDVFVQEEKVLCEFDIYAVVGAHRPLQLVDVRVSLTENGSITIRFEGVYGSPIVSGICIKRATQLFEPQVNEEYLIRNSFVAGVEAPLAQGKHGRILSTVRYEKKIEELTTQCQLKTDECYEAWMALTAANEELEKVKMELDKKCIQSYNQDQAMAKQAAELQDISSRYKHDKRQWTLVFEELWKKVKIMQQEHSQLSREAHDCVDSVPELNEMLHAVQALVTRCQHLTLKYYEELAKRKQLHNQIQEAKGNIRVFCRCRPLSKKEESAGCATAVDFDAAKDGDLGILTSGSTKKIFKFDRVYAPKDGQVDVFVETLPMVISVLDGYNVCIFAYGPTGTGKTFTMEGTEQNRGVNYRTLDQLFKIAKEREETHIYNISVSVIEVYNEQIRDLLATSPAEKKLEIRQASEGVHHVPGIVEAKVKNIKEAWNVLQAGSNARAVGSNNVNEHSSRSHCMLSIMVQAKNLVSGDCTKSKLWLVDLAGSERLAKTEAQGDRLKEALSINKSLSALGDVIYALATKSSHIPYRNSKLTHILQDSLGGESKTLMFVQISPLEQDLGETISSLNFASRVRGVELGPPKKQIDMGELQKLKMMLDKAKQELRSKEDALQQAEENLQNIEGKAKGKDLLCKNKQEKIDELETHLALKMESCRHLEKQLLQLSEGFDGKDELCSNLQQKVKELENKLRNQEHVQSSTLHNKVKEVENKLQERTQQYELHSAILQRKVIELENRLATDLNNSNNQKINELEDKLRRYELQESVSPLCYGEIPVISARRESKEWRRNEAVPNMETTIPRSYSGNRTTSQVPTLLKGTDSLREIRRKREIQSKESKNNSLLSISVTDKNLTKSSSLLSTSLTDKKIFPTEPQKARQVDPSRALARITRSTSSATQRAFSGSRITRDQGLGAKEISSTRSKVWL